MDPNRPDPSPDTGPNRAPALSAEDKRRMARRRFLARSATAGSGFFVVTLAHRRAFGFGSYGAKTVLVSSPEACQSVGGQTSYKQEVADSIATWKKTSVTVYDCNVPFQK